MRGVGHEIPLVSERHRETVQHVIERLSEDPDLLSGGRRDHHARMEIAVIHSRCDLRHPPQRP